MFQTCKPPTTNYRKSTGCGHSQKADTVEIAQRVEGALIISVKVSIMFIDANYPFMEFICKRLQTFVTEYKRK